MAIQQRRTSPESGAGSGTWLGKTFAGVLFPLLFLSLALVAAEICVRIFLHLHTVFDVEMARYAAEVKIDHDNPLIGHVHRPHVSTTLMNVTVETNAEGFRDREYDLEKGKARRIMFLGDSLTFGWGVEKEATFEHILEARLSSRGPVEIVNLGTGNYNTEQQVHHFLERGLKYRPDGIVLFHFINDAEPNSGVSAWRFLSASRLVTLVWSRANALLSRREGSAHTYREYYSGLYDGEREGWKRARAAFVKLKEAAVKEGIRLQVVLLPELHDLSDYPFKREHGLVSAFLEGEGIDHLDLAPALAHVKDSRLLWVATDDAHPNEEGHRLIAEGVYGFIAGNLGARE